MVAMVGLACARDLVLLFVLFDLTAVASYFLFRSMNRQLKKVDFVEEPITPPAAKTPPEPEQTPPD